MNDPERRSPLRRAALPLAIVVGTAAVLAYAILARRDGGDDPVVLEPDAPPADAASAPTAPMPSSEARPMHAVAMASASASGSAAATSAICAPIVAKNAEIIGDAGSSPLAEELHGGCFPTPNGAWAVRIDEWKRTGVWGGMDEYVGAWTLVHLDKAGHEVGGKPGAEEIYKLASPIDNERVDAMQLYDYDNDGEPEVLIETHQRGHEDAVYLRAVVATFVGGAVRELAGLPAKYDGFEDVDKDGRPDVLWHPFGYVCAGALGDVSEVGATFVAHSLLDGRFSVDDAVAKATVERACPKAPSDGGTDAAHAEVCALLRGATPAAALAVLEKECKRPDFDAGDNPDNPRPGVCFDFAERAGVLSVAPPVRLAP